MKRAGFTMIELIFVIVILAVLASVALPKFLGVFEQAHAGKVKAFVGTLNRSVGPALWAKSLSEEKSGSIVEYCDELDDGIDSIEELERDGCAYSANADFAGVKDVRFIDGNTTHTPRWEIR